MVTLSKTQKENLNESVPSVPLGDILNNLANTQGSGSGAGYTVALLTTAFGAPATLGNGFLAVYEDTSASKVYLVGVYGSAFYGVQLAAPAS